MTVQTAACLPALQLWSGPAVSQSPGEAFTRPDAGVGPGHSFFQNAVGGSDGWFNLGNKT